MSKLIRYLCYAWKTADSSLHFFPMGAVIVSGHQPVSWGVNEYKSHSKQKECFNPKRELHAEMSAILHCPKELLRGATIYVVRKDRMSYGRGAMMAKPCSICYREIVNAGIEKIVYSITGDLDKGPIHYGTIRL